MAKVTLKTLKPNKNNINKLLTHNNNNETKKINMKKSLHK